MKNSKTSENQMITIDTIVDSIYNLISFTDKDSDLYYKLLSDYLFYSKMLRDVLNKTYL